MSYIRDKRKGKVIKTVGARPAIFLKTVVVARLVNKNGSRSPDPIEAIKYRMEKEGLSNKDLAKILGFKSRVTDIFNGHRKLNLAMVRNLHEHLHISLESLIKEY